MTQTRFKSYPETKDSGIDWLGQIPKHWEQKPLWTMFSRVKRTGFQEEELLSVYRDYGVIPKSSRDDNFNKPSEDLSSYQLVCSRDLVTNKMKTWQGSIAVSTCRGIVSPAYHVYEPHHAEADRFLHYLFRSRPYVCGYGQNSKGIRVNQWDLDPELFVWTSVLLPTKDEQQAIAEFLDRETAKVDALVEKKERLIELLQEKRTALITHAVTKGLPAAAAAQEGLDPDVPMKDSGIEWLGQIPEHWEIKQLRRLTPDSRPIMYGIVLPGPDVADGVPIVKSGDIHARRLNLESLCKTTTEIESRYERSRLRGGDIVYSIRGSIGDCDLVPDELRGANLTQDAARVSPRRGVRSRWLLYMLRSRYAFGALEAGALGATIRGINIWDLKRVRVPFPDEAEQEAIATFLDRETARIDTLIAKVGEAIERLKEYRTALISAAVTGKIDVRGEG